MIIHSLDHWRDECAGWRALMAAIILARKQQMLVHLVIPYSTVALLVVLYHSSYCTRRVSERGGFSGGILEIYPSEYFYR